MEEKLLNINEASAILSLSIQDVESLVDEGKIPAFHLDGKYLRFRREDLVTYRRQVFYQEGGVIRYTAWDGLRDFFYFNDFYLFSLLFIFLILLVILKI